MPPLRVTELPSFASARDWVMPPRGEPPHPWLPSGLERLDDSWLAEHPSTGPRRPPAAAFGALPEDLARRARQACGLDPAAQPLEPTPLAELCARWCWGDLVDLPPALGPNAGLPAPDDPDLAAGLAARLPRLEAAPLLRAMSLAGLPALAGLLSHAPDRVAATICGRLPEAWRSRVWQARDTTATPDRQVLADLARLTGAADPGETLFALGARRFAVLWTHGPERRQTAQLLPMPVARRLLSAPPDRDVQARTLLPVLQEALREE